MDPTALGRYLRESREAKELTLEDAVQTLHIRREVFESFEQGNFDVADSQVRIRGMLRNYARFLGLEEERVLQYYEAAQDEKHRIRRRFGRRKNRTEPIAPRSVTDTQPSLPAVRVGGMRRFDFGTAIRNIGIIITMSLVSIAALLVIFFVAYNMLDLPNLGDSPTESAMAIDTSGTSTPTNTPSITPSTLESTFTPDSVARGIVGVQLLLEITQRSYVRILVDDSEVYAGVMQPDESMQLEGSESVRIVSGNAAALNIIYNDVEQGLFGGRGQQVDLLFGTNGIEVQLGDGSISATPTEQIILVTPTSLLSEPIQETSNPTLELEPSPTSLLSDVATLTPFLADTSISTATEITQAGVATEQNQAVVQTTATIENLSPTPTPTMTITSTPTATATSPILLPPRDLPANPTATKAQ